MNFTEFYLTELSQGAINKAIDKFVKKGIEKENVEKAVNLFNDLSNKNKIKGVDIFSLTWPELVQIVQDANSKESRKEKEVKIKDKETELVFQNDQVYIVSPKTHRSSCKYGSNTQWCITSRDNRYWNDYTGRGVKFYYIIPKDDSDKIAAAIYPEEVGEAEFYDAKDNFMNRPRFLEVIKEYGIPEDIFEPYNDDELREMLEMTDEEIEDAAKEFIIDYLMVELDDALFDEAVSDIISMIDQRESIELDIGTSFKNKKDEILSNWKYGFQRLMEEMEEKYKIDPDVGENIVNVIPYSDYDEYSDVDIKDIYKNNTHDWIHKYENMDLEDVLDDEYDWTDPDGLTKAQIDFFEDYLIYEYNNNHKKFESFYDDVMRIADKEMEPTNKVSDTIKKQLKDLIDKVEKTEYNKQDHPKLDLQGFKRYLYNLLRG